MIALVSAALFMIAAVSFFVWADFKFKDLISGLIFTITLALLFIAQVGYHCSKYPEPIETIYPINIAPNHVAYIIDGENIINISCIIKQNLTEKDKYVRVEYPGYWAGYVYVDGKVEHKIIRNVENLEP